MLLFGIAALAAANAYTALATSLAHLLASRVLAGFAAASISPMLYALAAEHAETERRASRMAQVNSGLVIALGLGAPFGLLVGDIGNWRLVFLGLASALTLMLPLNMRAWRTAGGPPPRAAQGAAAAPESLLQAWPHLLTMTAWASSVYAGYTLLATALGRNTPPTPATSPRCSAALVAAPRWACCWAARSPIASAHGRWCKPPCWR